MGDASGSAGGCQPSRHNPHGLSAPRTVGGGATLTTDILVAGGGMGGVASAYAALRRGYSVVLTEEYQWLGGQMTSQAVPPDEHAWVEQFGITRSYRQLREGIRSYYRDHYPLTDDARRRPELNPGAGSVSRLCHEPRVAVSVIESMLLPYESGGKLKIIKGVRPVGAAMNGDQVSSVTFRQLDTGDKFNVVAKYVVDATELGDLLPLTNTEYVTGFEAQSETGEPTAPKEAQPNNIQAFSICFVVDCVEGDQTIEKPHNYEYWRDNVHDFYGAPMVGLKAPDPQTCKIVERTFTPNQDDDPLSKLGDQSKERGDMELWTFRRIAARQNFLPNTYASDVVLINCPMIDYFEGSIIDVSDEERDKQIKAAADLSYSMFYWLQTEAPRPDGGKGFRGLRLRGDITGTDHGLAMAPYIRESRRIKALTTIKEQDLSMAVRGDKGAVKYADSVGVSMYCLDLHPSTGGDNYIDLPCCPFQIPLGALIPVKRPNLLAGCKNLGTTHITNGCYRLHPCEWNIGEVAGLLSAYCLDTKLSPHEVHGDAKEFAKFQAFIHREGVETDWPQVKGY